MRSAPVLAVFVGGKSSRMGSPKGALLVPGTAHTIVETLVARGRAAGLDPVFVGDAAPYAGLVPDVARIDDDPAGTGPLGGLCAVLRHARHNPTVTVACDMPFVTTEVLSRLVEVPLVADAAAVKQDDSGPWEPMLAKFRSDTAEPVVARAVSDGVRSFQKLFSLLSVDRIAADAVFTHALRDWDTPDDLLGSPR